MIDIIRSQQTVLFIIGVGVGAVIREIAVGVIHDGLGAYRRILIERVGNIIHTISRGAVAHIIIKITVRLALPDTEVSS